MSFESRDIFGDEKISIFGLNNLILILHKLHQ